MTEVFRNWTGPCLAPGGAVAAIGAFDGLHGGHRALLAHVRERAAARNMTAQVISFEPLPRAYFSTEPFPRLASAREKLGGFAEAGMQQVLLLRFNAELASMPAEDFVRDILVARAGVRELWVGAGFKFGHRRAGDVALLQSMGKALGFEVRILAPVLADGERVSSSAIRQALTLGDFKSAATLLGRAFSICGYVAYGRGLGRELGFPTANIHLGARVAPVQGIFAVRVGMGEDAGMWPGVASLGTRPTIAMGGDEPLLEAHLFDFAGDLYGQRINVVFVAKLRDEQRFDDLEALTAQMHKDAMDARLILGMNPALCEA